MAETDLLQRCLVYCRQRPEKAQDYEDGAAPLLTIGPKTITIKDDKDYTYDGCFGGGSTQEEVFNGAARACVLHCLKGYRASVMAYGQTGTGKSFTLCNTTPGMEGVVPRAAQLLFSTIAEDTTRKYTVEVQFVQIYRDNLGDLLTETGRDRVDIVFTKDHGVTLPGSTSRAISSAAELIDLFAEGNKLRVTTATAMNPESSRGHSALVIWVSSKSTDEDSTSTRTGKLTVIDLAGYERFSKTGISNSNPIMKDEAKTINASLLSLGHVVSSLSNGDKHVPWRNSKLTRLLQDSIGGQSRTTIILTVGPSSNSLHETTNTLQFGQRAMAVKVQAKTTEVVDHAKMVVRLQAIIHKQQSQISGLEQRIAQHAEASEDLRGRHDRDFAVLREEHEAELQRLKLTGATVEKIQNVAQQQDVERENLLEQQREELTYEAEVQQRETQAIVSEEMDRADYRNAETAVANRENVKMLESEIRMLRLENERLANGGSRSEDPNRFMAAESTSDHSELVQRVRQLEGEVSDLEMKLDAKHEVTVELQVQLERSINLCRERGEAVHALEAELEEVRTGARLPTDTSPVEPKSTTVQMVDAQETEVVRAIMEAEMAAQERTIEELRSQLTEARRKAPADEPSSSVTPRLAGMNNNSNSYNNNNTSTPRLNNTSFGATMRGNLESTMTAHGGGDVPTIPLTARGRRGTVAQVDGANAMLRARAQLLEQELADAVEEIKRLTLSGVGAGGLDPDERLELEALEREKAELEAVVRDLELEVERLREGGGHGGGGETGAAGDHSAASASVEVMAQLAEAYEANEALTARCEAAEARAAAAEQELADAKARVFGLLRELDDTRDEAQTAQAAAAEAKRRTADALQEKENLARKLIAQQMEVDDVREDAEKAGEAAAAHMGRVNAEMTKIREQLRAAEAANELIQADVKSRDGQIQSLLRQIEELKRATVDAVKAAEIRASLSADEASAVAIDEWKTKAIAAQAEADAVRAASAQSGSAVKMAELQAKLAVATRQVAQQKDEWAAAAARHKDAEHRLVASHEQHAASLRAVGAERDAADERQRLARDECESLTKANAALRERVADLEGRLDIAQATSSELVVKSVGSRNHSAVERMSAVMNEQHEALLSHLQNALFASRSVTADARGMRAEREALLALIKAQRAKYTSLQTHVAQLCGHIAECYVIMKSQRTDLTQRLTGMPFVLDAHGNAIAKDLASMMAERDEALHTKDQLIIDLTLELEHLRQNGLAASPGRGTADDDGNASAGLQSPRGAAGAAVATAVGFLEGAQYREHMVNIERSLRKRVDEANRATAKFLILREQLERLGQRPLTDINISDVSANSTGAPTLTREQLAAETSIDTSDLQILIDCKEAEIRVVSYRLEQRERALAAMTDHVQRLRTLLREATADKPSHGTAGHGGSSNGESPSVSAARRVDIAKALTAVEPEANAREQLEGMLSVMKTLRKQNGVLHSLLCDRGALLRHFAWLLVHHRILPANYDVNNIAGDQSAELRIAFAERDEELFMKDQALLQRCAEVLLLERSCRDLGSQVESLGAQPIRPMTNLSDSVIHSQRQTQRDVLNREQSRARLHEKHTVLLHETRETDAMIMAFASRLDELTDEIRANPADVEATRQHRDITEEVLQLRVKKDQLANALAIVDAQCSAHEDEVRLLRQVLAQSTRAVVDMKQHRDDNATATTVHQRGPMQAATQQQAKSNPATSESVTGGMMRRLRARFTT
jgi:hypothetical protein